MSATVPVTCMGTVGEILTNGDNGKVWSCMQLCVHPDSVLSAHAPLLSEPHQKPEYEKLQTPQSPRLFKSQATG